MYRGWVPGIGHKLEKNEIDFRDFTVTDRFALWLHPSSREFTYKTTTVHQESSCSSVGVLILFQLRVKLISDHSDTSIHKISNWFYCKAIQSGVFLLVLATDRNDKIRRPVGTPIASYCWCCRPWTGKYTLLYILGTTLGITVLISVDRRSVPAVLTSTDRSSSVYFVYISWIVILCL